MIKIEINSGRFSLRGKCIKGKGEGAGEMDGGYFSFFFFFKKHYFRYTPCIHFRPRVNCPVSVIARFRRFPGTRGTPRLCSPCREITDNELLSSGIRRPFSYEFR